MSDAQVRRVTPADVPQVIVLVRSVLEEFGFTFGAGSDTDLQVEGLPASYVSGGGAFFVAELDGRIVGTAGIFPLEPGVFELRKMYVSPAARGHGFGGRLFEECLAETKRVGGRRLVLDTAEPMTTAIALYERLGFVRDDAYCRGARCTRGYRLDLV